MTLWAELLISGHIGYTMFQNGGLSVLFLLANDLQVFLASERVHNETCPSCHMVVSVFYFKTNIVMVRTPTLRLQNQGPD